MLKVAFNMLTRMHSRSAQLRRPGSIDIYSPCRITPSNYFRFLQGPEATTIHGREFIIPLDTLVGQYSKLLTFSTNPVTGVYNLTYNSNSTTDLSPASSAADIQTALRLLAGLSNVLVEGSYVLGFSIVFNGFNAEPLALTVTNSTLQDNTPAAVTTTITNGFELWDQRIRRGDKIIDSVYGSQTIDELIEMVDVGGAVMGYRVRCE